ncbi:MAG: fibronectin type III domain-containing protein [Nitrospira sp.]|nr:fibronectin type III domain-containing protein [Nitrospira sp.]
MASVINMRPPINKAPRQFLFGTVCQIVLGVLFLSLTGCGAGQQGDPAITTTATPTGVMASLQWDPVNDSSVIGYYIHYGRQSPGQAGSCAYDDVRFVTTPSGTVTGLDTNSLYYFAVSAYNGVESACSNEVSTNT